jgi:hypothetical protein
MDTLEGKLTSTIANASAERMWLTPLPMPCWWRFIPHSGTTSSAPLSDSSAASFA